MGNIPRNGSTGQYWVIRYFPPVFIMKCFKAIWYADGHRFDPHVWQHISLRFGHEKISMTILSLPLIQEGQLSVTGERMGTKYW